MIRKVGVERPVTIVGMATLAFTLDGAASANDLARPLSFAKIIAVTMLQQRS